jgi:hypothetical protein
MMKYLFVQFFTIFAFSAYAQSPIAPSDVKFSALEAKKNMRPADGNRVSIQKIQLRSAPGMDKLSIRNVNSGLAKMISKYGTFAYRCGSVAQGHPWEYKAKLEKIVLSEQYISFVFARETVCAGTPGFERDPIVFHRSNGEFISSAKLLSKVFPKESFPKSLQSDRQLVRLNEEIAERIIDHETEQGAHDQRCEHYIKNSSYRIWMDSGKLALYPEFSQPNSRCQKEYIIGVKA